MVSQTAAPLSSRFFHTLEAMEKQVYLREVSLCGMCRMTGEFQNIRLIDTAGLYLYT